MKEWLGPEIPIFAKRWNFLFQIAGFSYIIKINISFFNQTT